MAHIQIHPRYMAEGSSSTCTNQSMGHSDVSMNLNVYPRMVPESQRLALDEVGAILDPNGRQIRPERKQWLCPGQLNQQLREKW